MDNSIKWTLVTGGAGFLGSHLCEELIKGNIPIICMDNLSTGSMNNIKHLFQYPHFQFIHEDIIQPLELDTINAIYNLACPASPLQYQQNPIQTLKTSVYGAMNMLELSRKTHAKILHTSTSEVYGDSQVHPQPESYVGHVNPIGLRACYNEGKRAAEALFFDYHRQYGIPIKIARLFNVYGPRMQVNDGRVIPNFILQALQNQPLTIYGDGSQTRSFCYAADMIQGLIHLMNTECHHTGPINLGNAQEISVLELAEMIINLIGSQSTLAFKFKLQDDPAKRQPVLQLAHDILGWTALTPLQEGLKQTIAYYESLMCSKSETPVLANLARAG